MVIAVTTRRGSMLALSLFHTAVTRCKQSLRCTAAPFGGGRRCCVNGWKGTDLDLALISARMSEGRVMARINAGLWTGSGARDGGRAVTFSETGAAHEGGASDPVFCQASFDKKLAQSREMR